MNNEKYNQIIDEVYEKYADSHWTPPSNPKGKLLSDQLFSVIPMEHSKESFINKCKTNPEFSKKLGLKIEERELSLEERRFLLKKSKVILPLRKLDEEFSLDNFFKPYGIPTKITTITYNNETIESYE